MGIGAVNVPKGVGVPKGAGARIMSVTKERRSFEFVIQRVSVAKQRCNAACILGTLPSTSELDYIFICSF